MRGSAHPRRVPPAALAAGAVALGAAGLFAALLARGGRERAAPGALRASAVEAETAEVEADRAGPLHREVELPAPEEAASPAESPSADSRRVAFDPGQQRGRAAGEERDAAPLRGRLVDERSGEPVPRYLIELGAGDEEDASVITDAQGRFETSGDLRFGQVKAWLSEAGDWRHMHHKVEQGAVVEHELSVAVGPTFYFDLDAPPKLAVEEMDVLLLEPPSVPPWCYSTLSNRGSNRFFELDRDATSGATVYGCPSGGKEALRTDGDPAWVRFPPLEQEDWPLPGAEGHALLIVAEDEPWAGVGLVPSLIGVQEERIPVRLERFCALSGRVSAPDEARVQNAVATLQGPRLPEPLACSTDDDGEFGFLAPAGRYELVVESRQGSLAQSVELAEGEVTLELVLVPAAAIEVAGIIRSATGTFDDVDWIDEVACLELRSRAHPGLSFAADVERSDADEGFVVRFRFDAVPPGSYELLAEPWRGVTFEPSRIEVEHSTTDLELLCRDDFERATLRFHLGDVEGNPLEDAAVPGWLEGERRPIFSEERRSDPPSLSLTLPAGASVHWIAFGEGYLPVEGTARAMAQEEVVEVKLERGQTFGILAVDPWFEGVGGVELLIDGAPAGRTNDFGYLTLTLESTPSSVKVRKQGWACMMSIAALGEGFGFFVLTPAG